MIYISRWKRFPSAFYLASGVENSIFAMYKFECHEKIH